MGLPISAPPSKNSMVPVIAPNELDDDAVAVRVTEPP
jgi:hypothetical protein